MMTSPYEWKILEWDDKPQNNKQNTITVSFVGQIEFVTDKQIADLVYVMYKIFSYAECM